MATGRERKKKILMQKEKNYTVKETAQILQRSEQTIRNWLREGRLQAVPGTGGRGREYLIPAKEVRRLQVLEAIPLADFFAQELGQLLIDDGEPLTRERVTAFVENYIEKLFLERQSPEDPEMEKNLAQFRQMIPELLADKTAEIDEIAWQLQNIQKRMGVQLGEKEGSGGRRETPRSKGSGILPFDFEFEREEKKAMVQERDPSLEEWRQLYAAAVAFKKAACWEWMDNEDVFGVQDPETGEIAYCSIMGIGGGNYGLLAYLGAEGLTSLQAIIFDEGEEDEVDLFLEQKCLSCTFTDREDLQRQDLEIIKALGLKFRGRGEWPKFRFHEPGYYPWFLNARQCRFLTVVLHQALEVSLRCREDEGILQGETPQTFLVRVPPSKEKEATSWQNKYLEAEPFQKVYITPELDDPLRLKRLRKLKAKQAGILEADAFFLPQPIQGEEKRPYFAKCGVVVEHESGLLLVGEMMRDLKTEGYKFLDALLASFERHQMLPKEIWVARKEVYHFLRLLSQQLGIKLKLVPYLSQMVTVKEGLSAGV